MSRLPGALGSLPSGMPSVGLPSKKRLRGLKQHLPLQTPWGELTGVGKVRRVVFWLSMVGNVGLAASAMTSGSDLGIKADGTKRAKSEDAPRVQAPPQREQAGEDPADEKRDEPEQQEGRAADATA